MEAALLWQIVEWSRLTKIIDKPPPSGRGRIDVGGEGSMPEAAK